MSKTSELPLEQQVIKCYHCGNETLMHKVGEHHWGSTYEEDDDFHFSFSYKMYACPICHKVTLVETYGDESMARPSSRGDYEWYKEDKILFPINSIENNAMPRKIKEAFESALKVRNIDNNICLMALRRTLELILVDKGATKWGLKDKIEEIAKKGILPESLKEASSFTKKLGDSAAHDKEIDVDSSDVNSMIEFVEHIIDYLYVLPYKIERYKKRIETA
jgi:hypothetical protein